MNKIISVLLIVIFFSCKSNSIAQEKEKSNTSKEKTELSQFNRIDESTRIAPGTVHLTGLVLGTSKNKAICGKPYAETATIKVESIRGSGSGIVSQIASGQEITFGFLKGHFKDFETLQQKHDDNQELFFIVQEGLCLGMNQTVYEILSFSIQ
ncbi:hypothetical protein [Aquimarina algicola]|uniref:Lipoprotein n=1 Tax=Aquimarina algicola TaxID=2589995 RepID=A0A504J6B0_9FLAO|nr:hypothetical protein [Aquimarina algicola]TPN84072.1 hypothetical protein FHK87_19115 [Aquimarina algicola]